MYIFRASGKRNGSMPSHYRRKRRQNNAYFCDECGISEWRGNQLTLIVDHIDGLHGNDQLNNLRLLCPNCNSQTPTFAGRNKGKNSPKNIIAKIAQELEGALR